MSWRRRKRRRGEGIVGVGGRGGGGWVEREIGVGREVGSKRARGEVGKVNEAVQARAGVVGSSKGRVLSGEEGGVGGLVREVRAGRPFR